MTDRELLLSLQSQIAAHLEPTPVVVTSPTGREPRLLWTPALQTTYNRMLSDSGTLAATWRDLIFSNANGNRYGDQGLWAALAYQMTGDISWVPKAWAKLQPFLTAATWTANDVREQGLERVILLDWLWPGLTPEQRLLFLSQLDAMFTAAFVNPWLPASMPVRTEDSDQVTGVYLGLACYAAAFPDHAPAHALFNRPYIGGLASTGRNRSTLRNCLTDYVAMAEGGEWIESGEYNLGTGRLLVLGAEGIRTATGLDHFPEVTAWKAQAAKRYRAMLTADRRQSFQWGDDQEPHRIRPFAWVTTIMLFDDPDARQLVYDLVDTYGPLGVLGAEPWARGFLQFDPYGPMATAPSGVFEAPGQGIISAKVNDSHLMVHCPPTHLNGPVDHAVNYFGDVQLYRQGGWALTHPITYGGVGNTGEGCNVLLHCGLGTAYGHRTCARLANDGTTLAMSGSVGGTVIVGSNYWQIPDFWRDWRRTVTWTSGAVDTIEVFDISDVDDPRTLPLFDRYSTALKARMLNAPLRQWRWHTPVPPVISGQSAEWPIPSGMARLTWDRADLVAAVVDQREAWPTSAVLASEKRWHLTLTPPDVPGVYMLRTVLVCGAV